VKAARAVGVVATMLRIAEISGLPYRARGSSSAARQNEVSIVLEIRHARTARLAQSMMATR
jgi:hypothetical protein